jgi:hypothetical protein
LCSCSRNRAWNPHASSSLAEEKHLCSLLLSTAARDLPTLATETVNFRPPTQAAYDESMAKANGKNPVRWSLWLVAGMLFGLALGFAFGLARPRARK